MFAALDDCNNLNVLEDNFEMSLPSKKNSTLGHNRSKGLGEVNHKLD